MDLYSGDIYWTEKDKRIKSYPQINNNHETDILIIGAGISGSLAAYYLLDKGMKVTIIDKRDVATGSTCASTSLLQYETDTHLTDLIEKIGKANAFTIFQMCRDAIYKIGEISKKIKSNSGFELKQSIYVASNDADKEILEKEFLFRKEAGFILDFHLRESLRNKYNISAPAAIVSRDGGQMDAYLFTQELLKYVYEGGVEVYDKTEAITIDYNQNAATVTTRNGFSIHAKHVILANGYEAQNYLSSKYGQLHSTYIVVSKPLLTNPFDYIMWETARPYFYLRATPDCRIIIGGLDEPFYDPEKRDNLLKTKSAELVNTFHKLFPELTIIPDYSWTGTFAESTDGLPFIGKHKDHPHSFFALGYGGNGITFSVIAAEIIRDEILGRDNPHSKLFSFDRS